MRGFTLIELLVVVLIIGILSAIALPQYQRAVERARTAEALAALRSASQAVETYILETGTLPASWDMLSVQPRGTLGTWGRTNDKVTGKYYSFVLTTGGIDVSRLDKSGTSPSFLYIADSVKAPVAGKKLYCYYIAKGTEYDSKMDGICKSMGGNGKYLAYASTGSTWFPLD